MRTALYFEIIEGVDENVLDFVSFTENEHYDFQEPVSF